MQLEHIGVALRPRTPREAMDLGIALLRANARVVWLAWFAFSLPCFALAQGLAWALGLPWLGLLLVWWLLPLFDRAPLYVLSRAVFEQAPSWRTTLRGQARWPWGPTLAALSWRRVDSNRVLRLPLEMLEGLPARQRAARWRVLRKPLVGTTSGLAWTCLLFALAAFASVWLFALLLVPNELMPQSLRTWALLSPQAREPLWWAATSVGYLALSLIEPVHVAAGFALYLNRRTQLEAWDIDLSFRRLRARLLSIATAALVLLCVGIAPVTRAADSDAPAAQAAAMSSGEMRFTKAVRAAYLDPRFGRTHTEMRWVPKSVTRVELKPRDVGGIGSFTAGALNGVLWLLLGIAVVMLAVFAWRHWGAGKSMAPRALPPLAPVRIGTEASPVLPDELAGAVRALWQSGRRREALALLYRGAVAQTAAVLQIPVASEATEADWVRRAAALDEGRRIRFTAIVCAWQYAAYADRYPDEGSVDRLLAGWPAQRGDAA